VTFSLPTQRDIMYYPRKMTKPASTAGKTIKPPDENALII
jgi:hypothetical protein